MLKSIARFCTLQIKTKHKKTNTISSKLNMASKVLKSSISYNPPETENVIELLKKGLRQHQDKILLIDEKTDSKWTGKQLERIITRVARFLIESCGVKTGDVCNLYQDENCLNAILQMSIVAAGGVSCIISGHISGRNLINVNSATNGKVIISNKKDLSLAKNALSEISRPLHVVSCDEIVDGCKTIKDLLVEDSKVESYDFDELVKLNSIKPEDFAVIQFSSGTTGAPKSIPRTHKNLCHLVASVDHEELMNLKPGDVMGGNFSVYHRPGLWAFMASIKNGSTFVVRHSKNIEDVMASIEKYKITIYSCDLVTLPQFKSKGFSIKDKYNLSSLKHIITSGAKIIDFQLPKFIVDNYKLESLRQCFGMTESGWVFLIERSLSKDRYLSVGHVVPGMEAIVIDPKTNEHLGPEQRGEIALRGPEIFPGYLTDKSGVFNRSDFTSDGWFKIGDEGYYTEDGLFFIVGRFKEQLRFKNFSERYYPDQIEAIVNEHPSVENSCAVKVAEIQDEYPYDVARVFVTLKPQSDVKEDEILDFVKKLDRELVIEGGVRIIEEFPRLPNGKINKQLLKTI